MICNFTKSLSIQARQCRRYYSLAPRDKRQFVSSNEIRSTFLDYFIHTHDHTFIRSSPVVPFCDPTVPFVNAGMVQFKNVFLNKVPAPAERVANSQKCIRIGGKHNDLSVVGTDGYHHTFFEMLGNWSFGDYFKEKACKLAWDLLTGPYMINPNRLYVTYFAGDDILGLPADEESYNIWRSIGVEADRIIPFDAKDNFWEMSKVGPCGPCTEIHIDHLPNSNAMQRARFVNAGRPDLTELWNIVFIEFTRNLDGSISLLPQKHIDTGMGLERLTAVLQGKSSNYDTDLFIPIFDSINREAKCPPYTGTFDVTNPNYNLDRAYRILADHGRMCAVSIADSLFPDRSNRLRKVLYAALSIARDVFKDENLLQKAVIPQVIETLGDAYPELHRNSNQIQELILDSNELYKSRIPRILADFKTLQLDKTTITVDEVINSSFCDAASELKRDLKFNKSITNLSGEEMLRLYNKFGLSEELVVKLAEVNNLTADTEKFKLLLAEQKAEEKPKWQESLSLERNLNLEKTDDEHKYYYTFNKSTDLYEVPSITSQILAIEQDNSESDLYHVIMDKSNFYYDSGGQESDIGQLVSTRTGQNVFNVEKVECVQDLVVHSGRFVDGNQNLKVGDKVKLCVDQVRRTSLTRHHTATHLLQAAIKQITGQIIYQVSSQVTSECLKFQFGIIGERPSMQQVIEIENLIRTVIESSTEVKTSIVSSQDVYNIANLTIVPGVAYQDVGIRLLKIENKDLDFVSLEPCCGTHAKNTSELQDISITACKKVGRRSHEFTAVCGPLDFQARNHENLLLAELDAVKKEIKDDTIDFKSLLQRIKALKSTLHQNLVPYTTKAECVKELDVLDKEARLQIRNAVRKFLIAELKCVLQKASETKSPFIVHVFKTSEPVKFKLLCEVRCQCNNVPVLLIATSGDNFIATAKVPASCLNENFDAGIWMQQLGDSVRRSCSRPSLKDNDSVCNLREYKDNFKKFDLDQAVNRATEYARKIFTDK